MKCKCGKEISELNTFGMCIECYDKEHPFDYCRTEKLHTGWICPKCGYVWAIWVEGCSNCNVPKYEIKSTGGTNHADKTKP